MLTLTGIAFAAATYVSTASAWWALAALLATGMVANALFGGRTAS